MSESISSQVQRNDFADGTPPAEALAFQVEQHENILIVVPSNEVELMDLAMMAQAAELLVAPLAFSDHPQLIVDLTKVEFLGSCFVSLLLHLWRAVDQIGGTIVLCGANEQAQEVLSGKVTAVGELFAMYDNRQEAIRMLQLD